MLTKQVLSLLIILILFTFNSHADTNKISVWTKIKNDHFGEVTIREQATDLLFIQIQKKVEDAAIIPIKIKSMAAQTQDHYIKTLHLFIDNNPDPHAATFHLSPDLGTLNLSTRIRIDAFSNVRVIAEMNDGSLHMISRFVIAAGGCSTPPQRDHNSADSRTKIKVRLAKETIGETLKAQILINHPNASGLQFDQKTGQYIPPHYVTNINISYNEQMLINVETGISISENPSIGFSFKPAENGVLKIITRDSKKQKLFKDIEVEQPAS